MSTSSSSELLADLGRASGHLVRRAQQRHARLWSDLVGDRLTSPQYAVLHVLGQSPAIDLTELGSRAALDRTTVGRVVARLADSGLVATDLDESDRRRRVVALTDDGWALLRSVAPSAAEVSRRLVAGLAPDETRDLLVYLRRMAGVDRDDEDGVASPAIDDRGGAP